MDALIAAEIFGGLGAGVVREYLVVQRSDLGQILRVRIGFQIALNGYAVNLDTWNRFAPEQQAKLQAAFDALVEEIWTYSEEIYQDAVRCNLGKEPCTTGKKFKLSEVAVTPVDLELMRRTVKDVSYPEWARVCDKTNLNCSTAWKQAVGVNVGIQ